MTRYISRAIAGPPPIPPCIIKEGRDLGFGRFHLYCDGDWLESFHSRHEADAEKKARDSYVKGIGRAPQ